MSCVRALTALFLMVSVSACGPSEDGVEGRYTARDVHGIHRLTLSDDGSYRQAFFLFDSAEPFATHESRWSYQRVPGVIVLATPMHVGDYAPAKSISSDDVRYWVRSCGDVICLDRHAPFSGKTSIWPYEREPD